MIGKRLIELRTKKKLTQKAVADKLKISRSTYSNYESDFREPDFKNAELLADIFGVSVDYLLGRGKVESEEEKELLEISKMIQNIPDPVQKKATMDFLKGLAGGK